MDIETSGLKPEEDFITCIGIAFEGGSAQFSSTGERFRNDPAKAELATLTGFSAWLETNRSMNSMQTLVTYNGNKFDIPFILERAKGHGLNIDLSEHFANHIDLIEYSKKVVGRLISKDDAARKIADLYVPRTASGCYIATVYKERCVTDYEHLDMLAHNSIDLFATWQYLLKVSKFASFKQFLEHPELEKKSVKAVTENRVVILD